MKKHVMVVGLVAAVCAVLPAAAAQAAPQIGGGSSTTFDVVDKTVTHGYVDKSRAIGGCPASNSKQTCTVQRGETMTQTVQTAMGAGRSDITTSLQIQNSYSTTSTVSCSIDVPAHVGAKAFAGGDRYRYHVRANTYYSATGKTTHKVDTAWSYAFDPHRNLVSCWRA